LIFFGRTGDGEGEMKAPVGGVGRMGNKGEGVELDLGFPDNFTQDFPDTGAPRRGFGDFGNQVLEGFLTATDDDQDAKVSGGMTMNDVQVGLGGFEVFPAAFRGVDQFLIKEGIPAKNKKIPDETQKQFRGPTGYSLKFQPIQGSPHPGSEKLVDDLLVIGAGIVVRDFPYGCRLQG